MKFFLRFGKTLRSLKLEGILFLTVFFLGLGALLASPQENKLRKNYELPGDAYSNLAQPVRPKTAAEELSFRYFPPSKDRKKAPSEFQNVRILYLDSASFLSNMAFMAKSLGVRCQYCHDLKNFASESIPAKQRAREMIQMVEAMNAAQTASPVDCHTCHQGQTLAVATKAEEPRTEDHVTDGDPPPADPPVLEDKDLAEESETIEEERPDTSHTERDVDGKEAVALAKGALFGTLLSHGTDYIQEIGRETFGEHFQVEANLRFERGISGDIDILLPFWSVEEDSTWFFQPGLVLWRDKHGIRRQDISLGLGHRFHWSGSIVGLGGFLDYGLGYGHSRLGVSVDYQSDAGYLSVNLYEGLSSWKKGRGEGEIRYQEIAMSGTELYWDYAVTEFLRLQGRASMWRLQDRNDQRDARTGYEVGFAYRLQSGTELVGGYSHYDQIHKNHWNLGLRFNLPSARDSVGSGSAPDLFRPIEREKRIFTEERVIKFSLAPPQLGARSRQTVFQGEVFAIEVPALPQRPMADVVITPSHSGPVFVEYSTQREGPFNAALALRFTPDNWDQGKTIWARIQPLSESRHADHGGVAGNAVLPVVIVLNYQSSDPRYDGLTASLTVEVFGTTATTLSQESLLINEGSTDTYTIVLNSQPATDVEIEMVSDNVDVTVTPSSLTFTASNWSVAQTATVTAAQDDDIADDSATISHRATSSDTDYHDIYINDVSVTVADDDLPTVTLVLSPSSIGENGGLSTVTATLDYASSQTTTITVSATAVSPAVPGDFELSGTTLMIAAGQKESTGTVTIAAMNNNVDAPNKSVTVSATVSNSQEVTAPSDVTLTILDDEGTPTVALALSASSIGENGGSSTVTATLDYASSQTTTITVSATAVSPAVPGDFELSGTTLTIAAGSTSSTGTVTITANDNTVDAPDKSVTVSATASNDQGVTNPSDETLMITDDEGTPTVTLSLSASSIGENGGSSTVTASLNHASSEDTTITVSAAAVSPAVAGDFTLSGTTLIIAAGQTASTGTVTITANDNTVDAPNKSVTVSATASNNRDVTNPSDETLTITDDEGTPTVTLSLDNTSIDENGGVATVTASLNHASSRAVTVTVSAAAVSPAVAGDFTLSANKALTIAANATTSSGTVTITANDNTVDASNKSVTVSGTVSDTTNFTAPSNVTLTILDDEGTPTVTLLLDNTSIGENGGVATVTASLNRASSRGVTVTVSATAVSPAVAGDFTLSTNKALTIAANATTSTGTVTITANDNTVDASNKSVTVSGTVSDTTNFTAPPNVTLMITDDDAAPTVTLLLSASSISENGGSSTVTASLNHASSKATTVTVSAAAVSPAVAGDFTLSTNKELTIAANATTSTGTVTITANNNTVDAPDKSVTVSATASNDQGVTNPPNKTLMITDDDAAPTVTLLLSASSISENGGSSTVTASLNHASSKATTVTVSAAAVSPAVAGDFTLSTNKELTIAANATTSTGTVTITANNNTVDAPDKSVTVSATASNDQGVTNPPNKTLMITDDDAAPTVTLLLSASSISENGGSSTVTASLNHASSRAVTVTVSAAAVSPAVAGDFTLSTNKELTIAANATTSTGTVTITAVNNNVEASDKSVTVSGTVSDTTNFTAPSNLTLTITDDDGPDGESLYTTKNCNACHDSGIGGAPAPGSQDDFGPRLRDRMLSGLYNSAINGIPNTIMSARGGSNATDAELRAIVDYMVEGVEASSTTSTPP